MKIISLTKIILRSFSYWCCKFCTSSISACLRAFKPLEMQKGGPLINLDLKLECFEVYVVYK